MSIVLSAADVFSAAILLEERGARFYSESAARFRGEEKKLLSGLASMERTHAERFRSILDGLSRFPGDEADADSQAFLETLTEDRIFTQAVTPDEGDTFPGILEKAITVEKHSVFFYTAVKDTLASKMDGADIDRLIREEIGHFQSLTDALQRRREREGKA